MRINIYLTIITTVLVITQVIRVIQNHISLKRQEKELEDIRADVTNAENLLVKQDKCESYELTEFRKRITKLENQVAELNKLLEPIERCFDEEEE